MAHDRRDSGTVYRGTDGNLAAAAATLDSVFLRKIPREKFRTKINKPRARDSYHNFKT